VGTLRRKPGRAIVEGREGGGISNGMSNAQMGETPLRCAHGAYETTCDVVGLVDPSEYFLATTGRRERRWDGGQLAMTQDARHDCLLGDGGNDPE
jgi:hypothetical protein